MRKCSETKRINADKRIQTELNEILAECVRLGYRPTAADFELRVNSITHLIYMRNIRQLNSTQKKVLMECIIQPRILFLVKKKKNTRVKMTL